MSLLSLGHFGRLAVSFYEIDIPVIDFRYIIFEGEEKREHFQDRTIKAAVDPNNSLEMQRIFGGSISQGDIGIYTTETLYISDAYDLDTFTAGNINFGTDDFMFAAGDAGGETPDPQTFADDDTQFSFDQFSFTDPQTSDTIGKTGQSFVWYSGRVYRVSNHGGWNAQMGINVYLAKRHLKQDGYGI